MADNSLSHVGQDSLVVTGGAVAWTLPSVGSTLQKSQTMTPRRAWFVVLSNPVRWRADGTDPTPITGMRLAPGDKVDWTHPLTDYWALVKNSRFCLDADATGDAVIDVSFLT